MIDFISNIFGEQTIQYVIFITILSFAIIGAKLVYWLFSKILFAFTKKTKTILDDLLVDALQKPVILIVLVAGFRYATTFLTLTEFSQTIFVKIFEVGMTISIAWGLMRITDAILQNYIAPLAAKSKSKVDDTLFPVVKSLVNFTFIVVTIIIILQNLGYEVTGLVAGLGIGGLAFALAAQDLLSNMFGGAAIVTDKPFHVGDRVKVDGQDGTVKKITLRSTTLKTFGGTTVVMPNKRIADSTLENVSSEKMRRVRMVIGLTYDTSTVKLNKAKKILETIVKKNTVVDDKVSVTFNNFGPSSLDIVVIYWIVDLENILSIKDQINMAIKEQFDEEQLDFAFPSQTIYLEKN